MESEFPARPIDYEVKILNFKNHYIEFKDDMVPKIARYRLSKYSKKRF